MLERSLAKLPRAPREFGRVVLMVTRRENGRREVLGRAALAPSAGMPATRGRASRSENATPRSP
jgi:hypothetical protein